MSSRGREKRTKMSQEPQLQLRPLYKKVSNPSMQVSLHREEGGRKKVGKKGRDGKREKEGKLL